MGNRPAMEIVEDIGQLYSLNPKEYMQKNIQLISPVVITSQRNEALLKLVKLSYFSVRCFTP